MRIKLRTDLKLEKRKAVGQGGFHQDFIRVLVIVMLLDEVLYQAVDVAATIWDATQKGTYTQQARKFYKWANQPSKNISGTPDNIDPKTKRKYARQRAKWFGKTWKEHLSDVLWNLAVVVFDDVRKLHEASIKAGLEGVTYYWNDEINEIERDVPEQPAAPESEKGSTEEEQDLPATPPKAAEPEASDQTGIGEKLLPESKLFPSPPNQCKSLRSHNFQSEARQPIEAALGTAVLTTSIVPSQNSQNMSTLTVKRKTKTSRRWFAPMLRVASVATLFLGYAFGNIFLHIQSHKHELSQNKQAFDLYLSQVEEYPNSVTFIQNNLRNILFESRETKTRFQALNTLRKLEKIDSKNQPNPPHVTFTDKTSLKLVRAISRRYTYLDD